MRHLSSLVIILAAGCASTRSASSTSVTPLPAKDKAWVFILAGQSNMAGRGVVEPEDTIISRGIFTINKAGEVIPAKEPLHFYEPSRVGLDCGLSFARTLKPKIADDVAILLIPTAVGGSSITQWLGDSTHRDVKLLTNFTQKVESAKRLGVIKGILWHQGESDANEKDIPRYAERLKELFGKFRTITDSPNLPILIGELGSYSVNPDNWKKVNEQIALYAAGDNRVKVIRTNDFRHKGDNIHFNSQGQRMMGQRFAEAFLVFRESQ
jgi:hypothetical protein